MISPRPQSIRSRVLQRPVACLELGDMDSKEPRPLLLQLHGLGDDQNTWHQNTDIHAQAQEMGFLVLCPDGEDKYWMNWDPENPYGDFLIQEFLPWALETFNVDRHKLCVGGLSMGGQGAMRLALGNPEVFKSVWSHSSSFLKAEEFRKKPHGPYDPEAADMLHLAKHYAKGRLRLALGFDCGLQDERLTYNQRFHKYLDSLDISHIYEEDEGAHTWDYWGRRITRALEFHKESLSAEK